MFTVILPLLPLLTCPTSKVNWPTMVLPTPAIEEPLPLVQTPYSTRHSPYVLQRPLLVVSCDYYRKVHDLVCWFGATGPLAIGHFLVLKYISLKNSFKTTTFFIRTIPTVWIAFNATQRRAPPPWLIPANCQSAAFDGWRKKCPLLI